MIQYHVRKEEVLQGDFKRATQFVRSLNGLGKKAYRSVSIYFSGYDDDIREIFEIDEIREWGKKFVSLHPYIFYFLNPTTESDQVFVTLIANNLSSFHYGERKTLPHLFEVENLKVDELPQFHLYLAIESEFYKKIERAVLTYAKRIKHATGGKEIMNYLSRFHEEGENMD